MEPMRLVIEDFTNVNRGRIYDMKKIFVIMKKNIFAWFLVIGVLTGYASAIVGFIKNDEELIQEGILFGMICMIQIKICDIDKKLIKT
jgi:hypothetical protein